MNLWKLVDPSQKSSTQVGDGPPKLGFWQSARSAVRDVRSSLPNLREQVRIQTGSVSDLGVYFARVRSISVRQIVLDMEEGTVDNSEDGSSNGFSLVDRTSVVITYDRGEALYHFQTRVVGPTRDGLVIVARPRQITRVQRRDYYRLPLQAPTTFRVIAPATHFSSSPLVGRLVNLSGGGAMLSTGKPIAAGTRALLRVPSGKDGSPMDIVAESLDCRSASHGRFNAYLVRFRFPDSPTLRSDDREAIIAYIYEQQRTLLRLRRFIGQQA